MSSEPSTSTQRCRCMCTKCAPGRTITLRACRKHLEDDQVHLSRLLREQSMNSGGKSTTIQHVQQCIDQTKAALLGAPAKASSISMEEMNTGVPQSPHPHIEPSE